MLTKATAGAVAVSVFFKPMLEDFNLTRDQLSMVQSVAMVVLTILSPFLGNFIDRYGPRIMIIASLVTGLLSRVINGVATKLWHLYASRILFITTLIPASEVLISRWFNRKRGTALGIMSSGAAIGTMLLPPLSQYMIEIWGWQPTMLFWAAVTVVASLPLVIIVRNDPKDKGYAPDGIIIETEPSSEEKSPGKNLIVEQAKDQTASVSQAIRTSGFWYLISAHFICGIGCGFLMTHCVIFAIDMGYSAMIAAGLVSVQGGVNLLGVLFTGPLSDRFDRKNVMALIHFVRSLSFGIAVAFIIMGGAPLWLLYVSITFFGFGSFTTAPLAVGLVVDLFGSRRMGTIMGVTNSSHMLGSALGAYLGGFIFERYGGYYWMFVIAAILESVAAILSFMIKKKKPIG